MSIIEGNDGNNVLYGEDIPEFENSIQIDYIWGKGGDDQIFTGDGINFAYGDDGNDQLIGGSDKDILSGDGSLGSGQGSDTLVGMAGPDELLGGKSRDFLIGGADDDLLIGGTGSDILGFEGFSTDGIDKIRDFEITRDFIVVDINAGSFYADAGLIPNAVISADQFHIGQAAVDASDRFIYDDTTGQLFFDADGTGSVAQIQFAVLEDRPTLNSASIYASQDQMPNQQIVGTASNNPADLYGEWKDITGDISYYDAYTGAYQGTKGLAASYTFNPDGTYAVSFYSLDLGINLWVQTIGRYTLDANSIITMTPVRKITKGEAGGQIFDRVETTGLPIDHELWVQGDSPLGHYTIFESLTLQPDGSYQATDPDTIPSYYFLKGGPHNVGLSTQTNGSDVLTGSSGSDKLLGLKGDDVITGGDGNDVIQGDDGNDSLLGDNGNDSLLGGNGNDRIWSGAGNDLIWSGKGQDVIALEKGAGRDVIKDFSDRIDKLGLTLGLRYGQLEMKQQGRNTLISVRNSHDPLAILMGVSRNQISRSDFTQIAAG